MNRISSISPTDQTAARAAKDRWDTIAKPLGGLGRLETAIEKIAAVQGTPRVQIGNRRVLVLCGDHGVVAEGVTQCGSDVTALCARAIANGAASVNQLASVCGAAVTTVDLGMVCLPEEPKIVNRKIAFGTDNFAKGPAMSLQQAEQAVAAGIDLVREAHRAGTQLLVAGEMGIGNTTATAALAAVLLSLPPEAVTGRGAGLDSAGLQRKIAAVSRAIAVNRPDPARPMDLLAKLGGYEIAGMAGLFLGGAIYRIPVILDGVIAAAAAAVACRIHPLVREYLLASHVSSEPAGKLLLDALGLEPVLCAGMHLGEGAGGVLLLPLLDGALAVYEHAHRFSDLGMERYGNPS